MADVTLSAVKRGDKDLITWETLTSTNTAGTAYEPERTRAAIATVQFTGTFDSGTAILQGSNDGTNWVTLKDPLGNNISTPNAAYFEVSTAFAYIRPSTSGGGGSQDIDCIICARG